MRTEAFYQDNYWIINGSKVMITNGGLAEVYCVIAKAATKFHEGKSRS